MNTTRLMIPATVALFGVLVSPSFGENRHEESREQTIELSQVPQVARDAVQKALGKEVGVHVLANGKVVKKEHEEKEERH